jgi:hypothetical protein
VFVGYADILGRMSEQQDPFMFEGTATDTGTHLLERCRMCDKRPNIQEVQAVSMLLQELLQLPPAVQLWNFLCQLLVECCMLL